MKHAAFYVHVRNTATNEDVSFERFEASSLREARKHRDRVRAEYGQIGCHEVKLLVEIYPDERD